MVQVVSRVTKTLFDQLKASLEYADPLIVAQANHLSMKTVLMVKGSETFADYEKQKQAQHPKSDKPPLGKRLDIIEEKLDRILALSNENRLI